MKNYQIIIEMGNKEEFEGDITYTPIEAVEALKDALIKYIPKDSKCTVTLSDDKGGCLRVGGI